MLCFRCLCLCRSYESGLKSTNTHCHRFALFYPQTVKFDPRNLSKQDFSQLSQDY